MPGSTRQWMKMPQDREFHVVGIFWGVQGYKTLLPRREGLRVQGMRKGRGGLREEQAGYTTRQPQCV